MLLAASVGFHQILKGQQLAKQAVTMRSKQIELKEFPRGEIMDRNLIPLTNYQNSQAVYFLITRETAQPHNLQTVAHALADALGNVSPQEVLKRIEDSKESGAPFVRIAFDLTTEQIARIKLSGQTGIVVAPISKRYSNEGFAAHIIGYVSVDGLRGQAGLEKSFDDILQKDRFEQELVTVLDARGMVIQGLMFKIRQQQEIEHGTVVLTIDRRIQQIVEDAVKTSMTKGAAIVLDINSREILAMVSRPTFDQYDIENVLLTGKDSPLFNRALNSYHPGSLFKILVAAAALEEKKVTADDKFYCSGKYIINDEVRIKCWQEEGHKNLTFAEAFANSCNSAFIETGIKLGRESLLKYADKLKVTDESIIGYPGYKADSFININPGKAAMGNASIGQQGIMLTPLQITSLIATVADDGYYKSPSLVKYTVDRKGKRQNYSADKGERVLKIETAKAVQELMEMCISKGTGKSAALNEIMVAGKTATSETGIIKNDSESLNAWFGGYLPAHNPRWAIVILVEEGTSGAGQAAPIFKEIAGKLLPLYTSANKSPDR
ncbi:MAG: penicillin-binding protein 2 [Syntrophomonadaceae bacterium]|nr:penicillin-binding protein 2 [Syntrophomonadaceae bacterium]